MTRLVLKRLGSGIIMLWILSMAVFALFFIAPNDVAQKIAGRQATPLTVALVSKRLGLNRPILDQYATFAWHLLHGNLGYSYYNSEPVLTLIGSRISVTFSLVLGGAVLWLGIGISTGVLAATHPRTAIDKGATFFAVFFYSMPTFLLGLILLYFFFYQFHLHGIGIFPGSGYVPFFQSPIGWAQHLILPWIAVALTTAATYTRLTRTGMLEVLGEDYIRTARAKGLRRRTVIYKHGVRAALTPVVTQLGIDVGTLLAGAIVTERVFGLPGLGQLALNAIENGDLPVVAAVVVLAATFIVVMNTVVDILYAVLDPRVRLS
jgi:peptide/nickel transport system permease protein